MDLLRKLHGLAVQLDPATCDDEAAASTALEQTAVLFGDVDTTVSSFEAWSSGLIDALLAYLTHDGGSTSRLERVRRFCSVFFRSTGDGDLVANGALGVLVRSVHGAINLTEAFPCDTLTDNESFLQTLKTPIKLQLVPADGTKLKRLRSNLVMIEPFASIQAIEDFLWPRVRLSPSELEQAKADGEASAAAAASGSASMASATAASAAASDSSKTVGEATATSSRT